MGLLIASFDSWLTRTTTTVESLRRESAHESIYQGNTLIRYHGFFLDFPTREQPKALTLITMALTSCTVSILRSRLSELVTAIESSTQFLRYKLRCCVQAPSQSGLVIRPLCRPCHNLRHDLPFFFLHKIAKTLTTCDS